MTRKRLLRYTPGVEMETSSSQHWQSRRMTKSSFTLIVMMMLLVASTSSVPGQVDSALGFFPLNTGDIHQYSYHYSYGVVPCTSQTTHSSYHIEQVFGDTLLPTGFRYKSLASTVPGDPWQRYLRVDTATANVYMYVGSPTPHEYLMDSLRATTGSTFRREWGYPTECLSVDTLSLWGIQTVVKRFRANYIYGALYTLAYGLGRIQHVTYDDDPCIPALFPLYRDLVFARVSNREYGTFVGVDATDGSIPTSIELRQNYPNPFNSETIFEFSVPNAQRVTLRVFDIVGQQVETVFEGNLTLGIHRFPWSATELPTGIYFARMEASSRVQVRKLAILK